ncbi:hypothetical protein ACIBSV_27015 [Embleya sp. NPDC050154]|uniref:hypothetical protein n=1 Tax=unclassified Embleya TaxID=2699296 RepID=UPI00379F0623
MTRNSPDVVANSKLYKVAAAGTKFAVSVGAKVLDAHTAGLASTTLAVAKGVAAVNRVARGQEKTVPRELAGQVPNPVTDRAAGRVAQLAMGF